MPMLELTGHVLDRATHKGVSGLRVEVWDARRLVDRALAGAGTGPQGSFAISLDEAILTQHFRKSRPELMLRVCRKNQLLLQLPPDALGSGRDLAIEVDLTAGALSPVGTARVVRGQLRRDGGGAAVGATLRALRVGLRGESPLGEATTDERGEYEIHYDADPGQPLNLVIRAFDRSGAALASSPVVFQADTLETLDLVVPDTERPAEYDRLAAALMPHLQRLQPADLGTEEVAFLSGEIGTDPLQIARFVRAARLGRESGLPAPFFFALLSAGIDPLRDEQPNRAARWKAAVEQATHTGVAPTGMRHEALALAERAERFVLGRALAATAGPAQAALGDLLTVAGVPREQQVPLLERYARHTGAAEQFWMDLRRDSAYGEHVDDLQFTIQAATLGLNHLPLVGELARMRRRGDIGSLGELARWGEDEWRRLLERKVDGHAIGAPPELPGADESERTTSYLDSIMGRIARAFPSAALAGRIARDARPEEAALAAFLDQHPDLDLIATRIDPYLREHTPHALSSEGASLHRQLRTLQRLMRVTPSAGQVRALQDAGFTSASDIVRTERGVFLNRLAPQLGAEPAARLYARAVDQVATLTAMQAKYDRFANPSSIRAAPYPFALADAGDPAVSRLPNLETLFGPLDSCACTHCQSVYSPAAYLADLLQFLGDGPRAVLLRRRPDLAQLELSCANTEVTLPALDLVNELLEGVVAPERFAFELRNTQAASDLDQGRLPLALVLGFVRNEHPLSRQARLQAVEPGRRWIISDLGWRYVVEREDRPLPIGERLIIAASPQSEASDAPQPGASVNRRAYAALAGADYPWSLPFDLAAEQARAFLVHLGVARHTMIELFLPGEPGLALRDPSVASERLHLTPREREMITDANAPEPWRYWGFATERRLVAARPRRKGRPSTAIAVIDPRDALAPRLENRFWYQELEELPVMLRRSGLAYAELRELLATGFVNQLGDIAISDSADGSCDLDDKIVSGVRASAMHRAQRFARLRRRLGWTTRELDLALAALGAAELGDELLVQLAHIERLRSELRLPIAALLLWWAPLGAGSPTDIRLASLYGERFAQGPGSQAALALNDAGTELAAPGPLSQRAPDVMAALGISAADLALLTDREVARAHLNLAQSELEEFCARGRGLSDAQLDQASGRIDLANLLHLHRVVTLARALGLSLRDLLSLKALAGDPFDLMHLVAPGRPPRTQDVLLFVERARALRSARLGIVQLSELLRHAAASSAGDEAGVALALGQVRAELRSSSAAAGEDRRPELMMLDQENTVVGTIATALGLEPAAAAVLLNQPSLLPGGPGRPLDALIRLGTAADTPITRAAFPAQFGVFVRLRKAAQIIASLRIRPAELTAVFGRGPALGWLDLAMLPTERAEPAPQSSQEALPAFVGWERLAALVALLERQPALREPLSEDEYVQLMGAFGRASIGAVSGEPAIFVLLSLAAAAQAGGGAAAAEDAWFAILAGRTGWSRADMRELEDALSLDFPESYRDERALERMDSTLQALRRLGVSAAQARPWATPALDTRQAQAIVQAARARSGDEETWQGAAAPLFDELREQRRDALVAYLIHKPESWLGDQAAQMRIGEGSLIDGSALIDHFLIDVEQSACLETSRVAAAIASVQLFVQRCRLNLEPEVEAQQIDRESWEWRKNYRAWEAARKIFLYPENWIEPELRRDKTPFFQALENELQQGEVTEESVEEAYTRYLERLHEVANLEICGMYYQDQGDDDETTTIGTWHVFGRSSGEPARYYYRRQLVTSYGAHWTAWEQIELDIEGDHLIPVIYNRRLRLFWPVLMERGSSEEPLPEDPGDATAPTVYWEMRLAWSERRGGRWTARQVGRQAAILTQEQVVNPAERGMLPIESRLAFRTAEVNGDLLIYYLRLEYGVRRLGPLHLQGELEGSAFAALSRAGAFRVNPLSDEPMLAPVAPHIEVILPSGTTRWYNWYGDQSFYPTPGGEDGPPPAGERRRLYLPASHGQPDTLTPGAETQVLECAAAGFRLLYPHQDVVRGGGDALFYLDPRRTFFVDQQPTLHLVTLDPLGREGALFEQIARAVAAELDRPADRADSTPVDRGDLLARPVVQGALLRLARDRAVPKARTAGIPQLRDGRPVLDAPARILQERFILADTTLAPARPLTALRLQQPAAAVRFAPFYHPYAGLFLAQVRRLGVRGLLAPRQDDGSAGQLFRQQRREDFFAREYGPRPTVVAQPVDEIDFSPHGAYAQYNWELFFHIPLLIANRLHQNQRFEEAQRWFHAIFDPTRRIQEERPAQLPPALRADAESREASAYWYVRPLYENGLGAPIAELLALLGEAGDTSAQQQARRNFQHQVGRWLEDPFEPHLIAQLRVTAYQWSVVMHYLDNLIAWADQLFRRDTREAIDEAAQLYVLAARILGPRPTALPPPSEASAHAYADLSLDAFGQGFAELENEVAITLADNLRPALDAGLARALDSLPPRRFQVPPRARPGGDATRRPYFCVPHNDRLLSYWDTIANRLFNIRHCRTIEGSARTLPLFEPPIDPGLLVRATAAGVDIASALADITVPRPHYRFSVMVQKATELCADVKALGGLLLSALEKADSEELARLRAGHELALLQAVRAVRQQQLMEAREQRNALSEARKLLTQIRIPHYMAQLGIREPQQAGGLVPAKLTLTPSEQLQRSMLRQAQDFQQQSSDAELVAKFGAMIPNFTVGTSGAFSSPVLVAHVGGAQIAYVASSFAQLLRDGAGRAAYQATMASLAAGDERREAEYRLQLSLPLQENLQLERQIAAADLRIAIAETELQNQERQIEQSRAVEGRLRDKFTNQELYSWMVGQVAAVYFQSYQLAYDVARRAEEAFHFELGRLDTTRIIQFGAWDNLRRGLLAGERLHADLKRLEAAYYTQNAREYELTKHVSLALHDPVALIELKQTGRCMVHVPEVLFDLDYPGHYMRRIKAVTLTIPCVVGPYTSVPCTLTLLSTTTRISAAATLPYEAQGDNDGRFITNVAAMQSIATSHGQDDSGMFELRFGDERYLPFEGAGAISTWMLEIPQADDIRQFDYDTIADVLLHLRYTSREGGAQLKDVARTAAAATLNALQLGGERSGLHRLVSARHDFPDAWHRFRQQASPVPRAFEFRLERRLFPYAWQQFSITVTGINLVAVTSAEQPPAVQLAAPGVSPSALEFTSEGELIVARYDGAYTLPSAHAAGPDQTTWQLSVNEPGQWEAFVAQVEDLLIVIDVTLSSTIA